MKLKIGLLIIASIIMVACSHTSYKDGTYTAQSAEFPTTGWKDVVEVVIQNGKIAKINWDAIYKDDTIPIKKKQYSKSGLYGMLAAGAQDEWYDQAIATEQFVLKNGVDALIVKNDGFTDAITGCSIHVNEFKSLLLECLEKAEK